MRSILVGALFCGCIGSPESSDEIPVLDFASFESDVQPILGERCGNPSCHGRADRPFSIYSAGRYRADPDRTFFDEPLTPEELTRDFARACGFAVGIRAPEDCLLLTKPLAVRAGGVGHLGGDVWSDRRETEYRVVETWLATARARTAEDGP